MQITDIEIGRYGVWRDLTLPLAGPGLNVLYGPNEAGKTTLMRFVRGVLFGFEPWRAGEGHGRRAGLDDDADDGLDTGRGWDGTLHVELGGSPFRLRRISKSAADRGELTVTGPDGESHDERWLHAELGGATEDLYRNVFAVGIYELQEMATLQSDAVAEKIYGASLGPHGNRFLDAARSAAEGRDALLRLGDDGGPASGRIADLLARDRDLRKREAALPDAHGADRDLSAKLAAGDGRVAELERKREDLRREIRGHRFLQKVHGPWRQVHECRAELDALPSDRGLSADGLKRLVAAEGRAEAIGGRRASLRKALGEAETRAGKVSVDERLLGRAAGVRALAELSGWADSLPDRRRDAAGRVAELRRERDGLRAKFAAQPDEPESVEVEAELPAADDADPRDVDGVDLRPDALLSLTAASRTLRTAVTRRSRLTRRFKSLDRKFRKREATLTDRRTALGAAATASPEEVAAKADAVRALQALVRKESAAADRAGVAEEAGDHWLGRLALPPWVTLVFWLFALGGAAFFLLGLIRGVQDAWLAGAIYVLLALSCGGLGWRLREHYESTLEDAAADARRRVREAELEVRAVRDEIGRLITRHGLTAKTFRDKQGRWDWAKLNGFLLTAQRSRAESDSLKRSEAAQAARGKACRTLRERIRRSQNELNAAKQVWYEALEAVGLPQDLKTEAALAEWQNRFATHAATRASRSNARTRAVAVVPRNTDRVTDRELAAADAALAAAEARHAELDVAAKQFAAGVTRFAASVGREKTVGDRPAAAIAGWLGELERQSDREAERRRRTAEVERLRSELADADRDHAAAAAERDGLLKSAGVKDRRQYESRVDGSTRRADLEELLKLAEAELAETAGTEPDLAVTEEDLAAFDANESREAAELHELELEELEAELNAAREQRAVLVRERDTLTGDARRGELRYERARLDAQLRDAAVRYRSADRAVRAFDAIRGDAEQTRQPAVLAAASRFLHRMTGGRYRRVSSPMGERTLRVEGADGRHLRPEQLSGGTREQLYLAVRLGLIENHPGGAATPPVVLDDVFVNFDQLRTEAALDTLTRFAADRAARGTGTDDETPAVRQILFFTCHLHLAHLFESAGVDPVWLPGHDAPPEIDVDTAEPELLRKAG